MKNLTLLLSFLLFAITANAQTQTSDVILKLNGEKMVGKVTAINDDAVKFVYDKETLVYTVQKKDIQQITYVSGRVEVINTPQAAQPAQVAAPAVDTHNKVAILPFGLLIDTQAGPDEMSQKIQTDCFNVMTKRSTGVMFQDPTTTVALLFKNGVNRETIKGFTMPELCQLLGVEYVVKGIVTMNHSSTSSSSSNSSNDKSSGDKNSSSYSSNSYGYTFAYQNYSTNIVMSIFNDKGNQVFNMDHNSFWQTQDAYKITLDYLAKKTPFAKN